MMFAELYKLDGTELEGSDCDSVESGLRVWPICLQGFWSLYVERRVFEHFVHRFARCCEFRVCSLADLIWLGVFSISAVKLLLLIGGDALSLYAGLHHTRHWQVQVHFSERSRDWRECR